jgi:O-antigen ligase
MQSFIKKVVWVCLAAVPFIALHVADSGTFDVISWFGASGLFFPFISGKNLLFRFFVEIALAGWAILALYDSSYRINIKKSPIMIAYSLFIVVLLLADLFGVDREKSMWSNFERMEGFVGHIHFFAYFFVLTVMMRNLADWQKMWKIFIAGDILVLIYAYGQLLGAPGLFFSDHFPKMASWFASRFAIHMSQNRLDATIGNSAYFGVFCLMYIFIIALLWSQSKEPKKQWLFPVLMFLNVMGLLYSGTRGTMIGLMVGGFISLGIMAWRGHGKLKKIFVVCTILFVGFISSVFLFKNTPLIQSSPILARIATISPNDVTGSSRLSMWKISYAAWKERPILGYGQDNFSYVFARKFLPEKMCNLEPWYDRSHNVFFDWLVAAGALGLLTYLSLYGVTLWFMWKKKDHTMPIVEKAILTGLLAGYFIHNFFVFDNLTSYILFFAVLAYITVRTREELPSHGHPLFDKDQMNLLIVPIIGIVLLVTQYFLNYRPLVVNELVIRAMSFSQYVKNMPFAEAVKIEQDAFKNAIAMNTLGSIEAREQYLQMAVRMAQIKIPDNLPQGDKQSTVEALNAFLSAARDDVKASRPSYKDDVRMLSIYGMFYNGIGDAASAEDVLKEARKYAPNKQMVTFDLIRALIMQKKFAEAYAIGRDMYDISAGCIDAPKWFIISAAYAGQYKEAKELMVSRGVEPTIDADVIMGVVTANQIPLAVELLQEMKKKDPSLAPQIDAYIKQLVAPKK